MMTHTANPSTSMGYVSVRSSSSTCHGQAVTFNSKSKSTFHSNSNYIDPREQQQQHRESKSAPSTGTTTPHSTKTISLSSLPRRWSHSSISSLTRHHEDRLEIFENEAPSTASSRESAANHEDIEVMEPQISVDHCRTPGTDGDELVSNSHSHSQHASIAHELNESQETPRGSLQGSELEGADSGHRDSESCTATESGKPRPLIPFPDIAPFSDLQNHSNANANAHRLSETTMVMVPSTSSLHNDPDDDNGNADSDDSVDKWLAKGNCGSLSDRDHEQHADRNCRKSLGDSFKSVLTAHSDHDGTKEITNRGTVPESEPEQEPGLEPGSNRISALSAISIPVGMYKRHEMNGPDPGSDSLFEGLNDLNDENDHDLDECSNASTSSQSQKSYEQYGIMQSIVSSPRFMDGALAVYSHLDDTLSNINQLQQQQLEKMKALRRRRKERRRNRLNHLNTRDSAGCVRSIGSMRSDHSLQHNNNNSTGNEDGNDMNDDEKKEDALSDSDSIHLNEHLAGIMQTLISSTTEMGSLLRPQDTNIPNGSSTTNGIHSTFDSLGGTIGGLLGKLSSSIAYISYISLSAITPILYKMVEAVLLELYATMKDVIEVYDPDPKNNILWRIINKMNEIIEAIQGLMALSDCFYEIASDYDFESDPDHDTDCGDKQKTL